MPEWDDNKRQAYRPDGVPIGTYPGTTRVDDTTTASVTYIGKAPSGTATSSAKWSIQKIDESSGVVITWADGNDNEDNVWDDRASLTYS